MKYSPLVGEHNGGRGGEGLFGDLCVDNNDAINVITRPRFDSMIDRHPTLTNPPRTSKDRTDDRFQLSFSTEL